MSDGRKYVSRAFATICIVPVTGTALALTSALPAAAAPDVGHVQSKVDALSGAAHHAADRYHRAHVRAQHAHRRLESLRAQLIRRQKAFDALREQVASSVVVSPQSTAVTLTHQTPEPPQAAGSTSRLTTLSQFDDSESELLSRYAEQLQRLQAEQSRAAGTLPRVDRAADRLRARKARASRSEAAAEKVLAELKERAAERASRSAERTARASAAASPSVATPSSAGSATTGPAHASGRAAAAVSYALAQVGKAYVYGAAGPGAFDCSGLTMRAWQQAGVSLPHSSSAQMGSGQPVSQSQLQPGDLVFYYSPVSHVGMYIGNGRIVNAENPGAGVRITGVNAMPYAGAVRPG